MMGFKVKLALVFLVFLSIGIIGVYSARGIGFREGYSPIQPINFSHKTHAGVNQIQCQYCHYASKESRHAGIPPTELCMNCHTKTKSQSTEILKIRTALKDKKNIEWIRVHNLPDYAYFNHSQHVEVGKVSCQACHGEVQNMERIAQNGKMNMGWCIECHRGNEISPPKDHKSAAGGDCARCHY